MVFIGALLHFVSEAFVCTFHRVANECFDLRIVLRCVWAVVLRVQWCIHVCSGLIVAFLSCAGCILHQVFAFWFARFHQERCGAI